MNCAYRISYYYVICVIVTMYLVELYVAHTFTRATGAVLFLGERSVVYHALLMPVLRKINNEFSLHVHLFSHPLHLIIQYMNYFILPIV